MRYETTIRERIYAEVPNLNKEEAEKIYEFMKHLKEESKVECEHKYINSNHLCTYCGEFIKEEVKQIEKLKGYSGEYEMWSHTIDKVNELVEVVNKILSDKKS